MKDTTCGIRDTVTFPKDREFSDQELQALVNLDDKLIAFYAKKASELGEARDKALITCANLPNGPEKDAARSAFIDADTAYNNRMDEYRQANMQAGYVAGQVCGFRLGFALAALLAETGSDAPQSGEVVHGYPHKEFSVALGFAMIDDHRAALLVDAMIDERDRRK